ncbi:MAG: chromate transporter [Clostridia bacterium]|nr:chromate transporter [Clostridia bacterium]
MRIIAELFLTFAKIGLFTFGGGYAMIPIIENICIEKKSWITGEDMLAVTAIAESTPGPIAINCATFVGFKKKGIPGAVAATLGVTLPSFVIIFLIANVLDNFLEITIVANAFKGIKCAVGVLILGAALKMTGKIKKKPLQLTILFVATTVLLAAELFSLHFSSVALIVAAALLSLAVSVIGGKPGKAGGEL